MIFGAENSRLFGTRANSSWTIYLQGSVVSIISRNELREAAEIILIYSKVCFQAHQHRGNFYCPTPADFKIDSS